MKIFIILLFASLFPLTSSGEQLLMSRPRTIQQVDRAKFYAYKDRMKQKSHEALEIRRIETKGRPWIKDLFAYTSDGDGSSFDDNSPKGMDYEGWPINQTAKLTQREKNWKKIVEDFKDSYNENSFQALVRAIKSSHLDGKKILIDDLRIERWLEKEKKLDDAESLLQRREEM